ncbi:MAG: LacI family DNA-binding transcriptional regulator [Eubacteriales bacterium]|nr:LacI family DNA-binding transcriptional regulator [Eubacteriales bacterium]
MESEEKKKKALNMNDVARLAGVSVATVSRVINNSDKVSKKTRNRVMKIIENVDYVPNEVARGLVTQNSSTIGILLPDIFNGYYAEIISYIEPLLSENGFSLQLCITNHDAKKLEFYVDDLIRRRVAGIIILSLKIDSPKLVKKMKNSTAVVTVEGDIDPVDRVCVENKKAMYEAVETLISNGHRRIAFIGYSFDHASLNSRLEGYKSALEDHHIPLREEYIMDESHCPMPGYHAMQKLLEMPEVPTAVQCINEYCARSVYMALLERGISIPDEISVSAFDGQESSKLLVPKLTTMVLPIQEMAREVVKLLIQNINYGNSETPRTVIFPGKIRLGDSVKKIN